MMEETWDDIVIGAGSSGAVLASRLSENPDRRVLLLESGADPEPAAPYAEPTGAMILEGSNWEYDAYLESASQPDRRHPYRIGRVVGGSSAVNGAIALRAFPSDFDAWAAAGNPDWGWEQVLPYFRKLEADGDYKGAEHGTEGMLPIRRTDPAEFDAVATGFVNACCALGLAETADLNAAPGPGVGSLPLNWIDGRRMSTAATYLAAARGRANLTVRGGCQVSRVIVEGGKATGVEVLEDGTLRRISAGRVTVCAGAVNTPPLLERSGLGDPRRLRRLGVEPVADLPGVGENLMDHAAVSVWGVPKPGISREGDPLHSALARLATAGGDPDLAISLLNNVPTAFVPLIGTILGGRIGMTVAAVLLRPASRGRVHASDAEPDSRPVIELNLLSEPADVDLLMTGARTVWSVMRSQPVGDLLERVVLWTDRMMSDETMLRRSVLKFGTPQWHASGTARMGPGEDAVVDQLLRVRGLDRLHVVDASVLPEIPSTPTNLTCIMLAERAASWMAD